MPPIVPNRRKNFILGAIAVLLVLVPCLVLLRVLTLWRPAEWRSFDGMPDEMLKHYERTADDTLNEWLDKINRKDGRSYGVVFTEHQINACCATGVFESEKVPDAIRERFRDFYVMLKPDLMAVGLRSGIFGIGTVIVAFSPKVSPTGDISARFKYAKLGAFPIPPWLALRIFKNATSGTKIDGLFFGKDIDPADLYPPFIVVQIDSLEIGDAQIAIKGHIK